MMSNRGAYKGEAGVDRFHIAHVLNHRSVTHNSVTAISDRYRPRRRAKVEAANRGGALRRTCAARYADVAAR